MTAPLQLSRDEMQALGDRALDMVIQHFETNRENPTARTLSREEAAARLHTSLPERPTPPAELLELLAREVFPNAFHPDHPRFYAFVPSPTNFVSVVGDFLMSGHNIFSGHWLASSAASQIELTVLEWLREACGLPATGSGILVSGGSMANLSAIVAAREARLGGHDSTAVVYCSDQTHSSMFKGLRILGFGKNQRRAVATDEHFRLSVPALAEAIAHDRANGMRPFCVVANAGTTNTGAIDPFDELADLCAREGLWLHVDGAYGAAAVFTERGKTLLRGLGRADSITLDPHKWLFQPYELGCLLVRDAATLTNAFSMDDDDHADYLADVSRHVQQDVNFYDRGIQLTRGFKALKLWLSMRTFGMAEFRRGIEVGFEMAEEAERLLRADGRWSIVTPAAMGIVTFRWHEEGRSAADLDAVIARTADRMRADGYAMVMSTMLKGRPAFRLCPIHPATNAGEIAETIRRLTAFAEQESAQSTGPG
ncbi:pyridoxal phosphate-dependent decarboxylase family protein [Gemmatimonas sp.]|uniref:pyridoxal phosphate-dependent decarboxylase family protein n=1 Tax=Gemmatimonas sp. TaxID=1962908 RepID=UPI003F721B3B